jgi:hypothetical protein
VESTRYSCRSWGFLKRFDRRLERAGSRLYNVDLDWLGVLLDSSDTRIQ